MPIPSLRGAMAEGFVLSAWSGLADPLVHEALLRAPFDAIAFDVQHGLHDVASVMQGIAAAARAGKPSIVRVPIEDRAMVSRSLDFGASAVVMPMIETADDARAFISVAKYPPTGLRSYGPTRALDVHGYANATDYTAAANRETLCLAMIETRAALANLDAIAAIDALDGFFVGPSDLSIALSEDAKRDPESRECLDAIRRVLAVADETGKLAAIYAVTAEEAKRYRDFGYRLVCVSSDIGLLKSAAAQIVAAIKA